jgi:uncharacterized radical SAM superfamily Fe-S cluster-containing enzyme
MSHADDPLTTTTSLCPQCLEQVPGAYESRDGGVYLTRECETHGTTSRQVWGSLDHWEWAGQFAPEFDASEGPVDLTVDHDHACLAIVEVTEDCNLSCDFCFASSGPGGTQKSFEDVIHLLDVIEDQGGPRPVQFSGGEPTVRDDLPELVAAAADRGFEHVEVNTNGLRLAREDGYAQRLADAGVTAVYLQFDGLERETYVDIRSADILEFKHAAIEACRAADLPIILVPTLVPGTNEHEMGDIVAFALENADVIRSVNFQPVAHFGRYERNDGRFSLDEAARLLTEQFDALEVEDILPAPCCSAYCQIGTALLPRADGPPLPLTRFITEELWDSVSGMVDEGDYMELLAGTAAGQDLACSAAGCCGVDVPDAADDLFDSVVPISITGFMDADAADVNRLENCCLSVPTPDGDLVPFCGYNMTTEDGEYALRNRNGWGGRETVAGSEQYADPEVAGEEAPDETLGESDD